MRKLLFLICFSLVIWLAKSSDNYYAFNPIKFGPNLVEEKLKDFHPEGSIQQNGIAEQPVILTSGPDSITVSSGTINLAIPDEDANGVSHTLIIGGIPTDDLIIDSVIVSFTVEHEWLADVVINLEAPNGQTLNLVGNRGEASVYGFSDVRVTSDNTNPAFPSGYYGSALTGTYKADAKTQTVLNEDPNNNSIITSPAVSTSTFSNLFTMPNGNWKIRVYDVYGLGIGVLVNWSIKIRYTISPPLPISLHSFSGYRQLNKNLLQWTTAVEQNNRGFSIERSTDGVNYSTIGFVKSQAPSGNSNTHLNYSFTDNDFTSSKQYYRLRQTDIDGREMISNVVLIKGASLPVFTILSLFPNPAISNLQVMINAAGHDVVNIQVLDMYGRLMFQNKTVVGTGVNNIPVQIENLAEGNYILKVSVPSTGYSESKKFSKL